jgi:tetratricopeptide (TPR) repeat protein
MQLKQYQEAINAYDRALRYQPDYKQAKEGKSQAQFLLQVEQQKLQQEDEDEEEREESIFEKIEEILTD